MPYDLNRFPALLGAALVASLASACVFPMPVGDVPEDGTATSDGSGAPTTEGADPSATTAASTGTDDDGGTSTDGGSTSLDGDSTGEGAAPCDACAGSELCVIMYDEKNCLSCDSTTFPPFHVECVAEQPDACDDALSATEACTLALCGTPHASSHDCGCPGNGDFDCGVNPFVPDNCDYWDFSGICSPGSKCAPTRDEQLQPLPFTECFSPAADPPAIGAPCLADLDLGDDPCDSTAYCDEVDPETMMGVCRALCVGDVTTPTCADAGQACVLFAPGQPEFGGVCRPA
ncbi:MAG: hypothetical protein KDK70_07890 [Myxococcales bacterium]|nr:hypothetical protein [Myxococcales bacterium]